MNKVKVLDCTLRDGGYINNWEFGKENIKKITTKLLEANIDIIECGFLTEKTAYSEQCSKYDTVQRIADFLPREKQTCKFVCMINYGEYEIAHLPEYDGSSVNGIRVAFHKKDMAEALKFCREVSKKGYKLFMQPMVSVSYTDTEFLHLIDMTNEIQPYAFYIVDSFGVMKKNDLMRLFYLVDHNLDANISVGYHSHNNIQLSFSNAQALVDLKIKRELIMDSSVFGMGRGAGNLNTELFIEYLNDNNGGNYKSKPLLQIIDQVLNNVYLKNYWGYSLPHYISAKHNCHPNYASHLADKGTLKVEDISDILSCMDEAKKTDFDRLYIEDLYCNYQNEKTEKTTPVDGMISIFKGKDIVAIAPGRNIKNNIDKINKVIAIEDTIAISINFKPSKLNYNYIFVSNHRRYEEIEDKSKEKFIITSNIRTDNSTDYIVNYADLLNNVEAVRDNAGLMLIKLMIKLGAKSIKLAGFDGYTYDAYTDYAENDMTLVKRNAVVDQLNEGMISMLKEYSKQIRLEFITKTKYLVE